MALCYLTADPRYPQTMTKWKGRNDYKTNKAKVRTLMDTHFIPYSDAPPAVFVDTVDDEHELFVPDTTEQE